MPPGKCELQAFHVKTWSAHWCFARMLNTELSEAHKLQVVLHGRFWQQMGFLKEACNGMLYCPVQL